MGKSSLLDDYLYDKINILSWSDPLRSAIIDLKKYGEAFENFMGGLVATSRIREPKSRLATVRKRLDKK